MFVSRETQEKLDALEQEKVQLQKEVADLQSEAGKKRSGLPAVAIVGWVLFLLAAALAVYALFFKPVKDPYANVKMITANGPDVLHVVPDTGIVYHVQIGAFKEFSLDEYASHLENIYTRENDSLRKISLGQFYDFTEAQDFLGELSDLGMDFAYITAYKNGSPMGLMEAVRSVEPKE